VGEVLRDVLYSVFMGCVNGIDTATSRDMYGAHVTFMHENVMEMCGEMLANWRCRSHERGQRGRREVLGDSRMYGGKQR